MPGTSKNSNDKVTIEPTRRQFVAMGAVATTVMGWSGSAAAAPVAVSEHGVSVSAERGQVAAQLFKPQTGEQPGLVMFAHAAASPSANAAVARQLAQQGWAVLLVASPTGASPEAINRNARAHTAWLNAQPGVTGGEADGGKNAYCLRTVAATYPRLSLASRAERQAAAKSAILFAVPAGPASNTKARAESLADAARALHRFAA